MSKLGISITEKFRTLVTQHSSDNVFGEKDQIRDSFGWERPQESFLDQVREGLFSTVRVQICLCFCKLRCRYY